MKFDIGQLLQHVTRFMPLYPGPFLLRYTGLWRRGGRMRYAVCIGWYAAMGGVR